jgi:raffinose/stachyose/melibiose transport system permease protein
MTVETLVAYARPQRRAWGRLAAILRPGVSWGFILPALALYGVVVVYPMLAGVGFAFTDWDGLSRSTRYVGLENFWRLWGDRQVVASIETTLILAGALVVSKMIIGLALALALDTAIKTRNLLRLLFFMPVVLTPVITSFVWKYIFSNQGAINVIADTFGLGFLHQGWLGDPRLALVSIMVVTAWQTSGLAMVIFLAGLQAIPRELIEAASMDGSSAWQRFRMIVLPLLAPAITVNVILALIQGLKFFDQVFVLTGGGPGYATETLSTIIYKTSFIYSEFGYGSAISLVFSLIVGVVVFSATVALRRREIAHG